jgi:hypothetical protein
MLTGGLAIGQAVIPDGLQFSVKKTIFSGNLRDYGHFQTLLTRLHGV